MAKTIKTKTIKLFLASSSELQEDRKQFEIFISRKSKNWLNNKRILLELSHWENFFEGLSRTRMQDEYNKAVRECDIFVMLFFTKVGKYTKEEFEKAFGQFQATNKPFIFTYFKDTAVSKISNISAKDKQSVEAFQKKLKELGHFQSIYENIHELKYKFGEQLDELAARNFTTREQDKTEPEQNAPISISPRLSDDSDIFAEAAAPTRKKPGKPSKSQTYPSSDRTSNPSPDPNNPPKLNRGDESRLPNYKGLDPYKPWDSEYFFGRGREIKELISLISDSVQMLHIRGGSGVGKSSMVLAGLLPRLGKTSNNGIAWDSLSFRPFPEPFLALAAALNKRSDRLNEEACKNSADKMYGDVQEFIRSLTDGIELRPGPARRVLYIDQLEELLLHVQGDTKEQRCRKFVEYLSKFLNADLRNLLITSIRTDRDDLLDLAEWNTLRTMINAGRQYRVIAPEEAEISEIVWGPARMAGFTVEDALVTALKTDVKGLTNWPPLLSVALESIVERWRKHPVDAPERCLTLKLYQAIGGLAGVIERRAEKVTGGLSDDERNKVLPQIFSLLVRLNDAGRHTKRRYIGSKVELPPAVQKLLNSLIADRLLVEEGGVEIIHDILFLRWKDLSEWIKTEKEYLDELSDLEHQAKRWERRGKSETDLLGKDRIERAESALKRHALRTEESPILKDFVADSRTFRDQEALKAAITSGEIWDVYRSLLRKVTLGEEQIASLGEQNVFYYSLFPERIPGGQTAEGTGTMATSTTEGFKEASEIGASVSQARLDFFTKDKIDRHVNKQFMVQHFAALAGHVDLLAHFKALGAKMSAVNDNGTDALTLAAYGGHLEALKWLAEHSESPKDALTHSKRQYGRSPIHWAAQMGHSEIVQYLIEQGANVDEIDDEKYSVLDFAAYSGNPDVVKILLNRAADPGRRGPGGNTPLQLAIGNGKWDNVRSLLDNAPAEKLQVNNVSDDGWTALGAAIAREVIDFDVVRRLLAAGADPNPKADKGKGPPLALAAMWSHKSVVDLLIEKQADVNLPELSGRTALHHAVMRGQRDILKSLLACAAIEVDVPDSKGMTPLFHAALAGEELMVTALLDKGAKADRNLGGGLFILEAAFQGANEETQVAKGRIAERLYAAGAPLPPWREFFRDDSERIIGLKSIPENKLNEWFLDRLRAVTHEFDWRIPPLIDGPWSILDKTASAGILGRFVGTAADQARPLRTVAIAGVRTTPLSVYSDGHLYEVSVQRGDGLQGYLTFLETAGQFVLIDGKSAQIHDLNKQRNLSLETEADAAAYLCFFCSSISGEEGIFRIFEQKQQLLPLENLASEAEKDAQRYAAPLEFAPVGHGETGQFICNTAVKYSNAIFKSQFKVHRNGFVEMLEDTPVVQNLNVYVEIFNDGIRTIQAPSKNTDENTDKSSSPEDSR